MNSNRRTGRRDDREFKNNAVALVRSGRTVTEVARDLGVSKWSLGRWIEQAKAGQALSEPKTLSVETADQCELRRLRQEQRIRQPPARHLKKSLRSLVSGTERSEIAKGRSLCPQGSAGGRWQMPPHTSR